MNITRKLRAFTLEALLLAVLLALTLVPLAQAQSPRAALQIDDPDLLVVEGQEVGDTFTVVLDEAPTAAVTLTMSYDTDEITVLPETVTFDETNWDEPQTVGVRAPRDIYEGQQTEVIELAATSDDADFDGLAAEVIVSVVDQLLTNPSFEVYPFTRTEDWSQTEPVGRLNQATPFRNATDFNQIMVFDGDGRGTQGVTQDVPMPFTGKKDDSVVFTFDTGGRNTGLRGFIGGRIFLISSENGVVGRDLCVVNRISGTFGATTLTCEATAAAPYDTIRVQMGGLNVPQGLFGFDRAALYIPREVNFNEFISANTRYDDVYSIFGDAVAFAGLLPTFGNEDANLTLFGPRNTAFAEFFQETETSLEEFVTSPQLSAIMRYHLTEGQLSSEDLTALDGETITMGNGGIVTIDVVDGEIVLNLADEAAMVVNKDIQLSNGTVHVIDAVLTP